jgi:hypothetical protein
MLEILGIWVLFSLVVALLVGSAIRVGSGDD